MSHPDYKALSRGESDDMSPRAIARRLEIASQLYRLARTLQGAEHVHDRAKESPTSEVREAGPENPSDEHND